MSIRAAHRETPSMCDCSTPSTLENVGGEGGVLDKSALPYFLTFPRPHKAWICEMGGDLLGVESW